MNQHAKHKNEDEDDSLKLKIWYNKLDAELKKLLKAEYIAKFGTTEKTFYRILSQKTIPHNQALFFARFFSRHVIDISSDDLIKTPQEVIQHREKEKKKTVMVGEPNLLFKKRLTV